MINPTIRLVINNDIINYLDKISEFRIKEFKEFPYLYEGNEEYEKSYIKGFIEGQNSVLGIVEIDSNIIGVATAMPLRCEAEIVKDVELEFHKMGFKIDEFFYIGEVIVKKGYRGNKISSRLLETVEKYFLNLGFKYACLSTVERDIEDSRRPKNYSDIDKLCLYNGYTKTKIYSDYSWPMKSDDGSIREVVNEMVYWIKKL